MAKVTGGLLSFDAKGTVGKAVTFARWRGVAYARQRVVPANPQTVAQQATRSVFTAASAIWKGAGSLIVNPWDLWAKGQPKTGRNGFIGAYVKDLRLAVDNAALQFSPGAKGGLATDAIALTPAVGEITVAFTNPTPPPGWTIDAAVAGAIPLDDPAAPVVTTIIAAEDIVTFNSVVLTGLLVTTDYVVGAWLRWLKPDGSFAYGPSINDQATTL